MQRLEPGLDLYVPASHAVQFAPSAPVYPLTQTQFVRLLLPFPACVLLGQLWHVPELVAFRAGEYVSEPHMLHAKLETAHSKTSVRRHLNPPAQKQQRQTPVQTIISQTTSCAQRLRVASAQFQENTSPDALYFPPEHAEQGPPSRPVNPALQMHKSRSPLPACDCENPGHGLHVASETAPRAVE